MSKQQTNHTHTNQLIHENSPYLLQHAHNPVNWYPWGKEALEKAKRENKIMLISIGYAACHWCHVMEHESFEDSTVAKLMNDHFVNIKVDREERPDIDDVYMTACQLISQRGCGWPLNAFALPDGRPVWAGTYFPKEQWMNVLNQFQKMWTDEPSKLDEYAAQLTQGIQQQEQILIGAPQQLQEEDMQAMADNMIKNVDPKYGGREGAPKFPMPANYFYLLNYHIMTGDPKALEAVEVTLDQMAWGGIYDQLGGGFARYSVDALWLVPHFEKMLYDNGQLLNLYSAAFQVTHKQLYKDVIYQMVEWLDREMTDSAGGFYSSLDADSEGEEGKFYVWTTSDVEAILSEKESRSIQAYYNFQDKGNWEHGKNILHRKKSDEEVAQDLEISVDELGSNLRNAHKKLFEARAARVRPGLDDKVLTSWNGLILKGLVQAYKATQDDSFLERALRNGLFIRKHMLKTDYRMDRNYKDG
ncbi:MAG: thioredoxin domain-containing protein, partial [Saprospiraceae bacterium]|nr:thioredoxin domain-containing protein [Saprospiraceae bacterium]